MNEMQFDWGSLAGVLGAVMFAVLVVKGWVKRIGRREKEPAWDSNGVPTEGR